MPPKSVLPPIKPAPTKAAAAHQAANRRTQQQQNQVPKALFHMTNGQKASLIRDGGMRPDHMGRVWFASSAGMSASRDASPNDTAILCFRPAQGDNVQPLDKAWVVAVPQGQTLPSGRLLLLHRNDKKFVRLQGMSDADIQAACAAPQGFHLPDIHKK